MINNSQDNQLQLDHIAVQVEDLILSIEWYQKHLDAEVQYCDETWAMLKIGSVNLALTIPQEHPPHIAFEVSDLNAFPEGEIKRHRDGSTYVYFEDPSGNVIEYICWNLSCDKLGAEVI
jgi:catechol 2,3-dioxygenase-like lactoylglutathione lyase family enzyme|tara:strand:+ start:101 stop:457 length:357 start_codon:yes stop_codon:yes gene_type:complete